jgi:Domain of unknown function (DUF4399)
MQKIVLIFFAGLLGATAVSAGETPAPADAKVFFENLKNGDTVTSPVLIKFGISGMNLAPAGDQTANTGHHHLIIDDTISGDALNAPIPADDKHIHFGKAQTEATVNLPKGTHTLQLLLGDWTHIPHKPPVMSEKITVTVK